MSEPNRTKSPPNRYRLNDRFVKTVEPAEKRTLYWDTNVHGRHPFSCDFELIRFMEFADGPRAVLIQNLYGRGHAMLRIGGERGALCEMTSPDDSTKADVVRKLRRLEEWSAHFGIVTKLSAIVEWVATGPHDDPLRI